MHNVALGGDDEAPASEMNDDSEINIEEAAPVSNRADPQNMVEEEKEDVEKLPPLANANQLPPIGGQS